MSERPSMITKLLSQNDTGETGGHQAGVLVPRDGALLAFFPALDPKVRNPRHRIYFTDVHGKKWEFSFIYYNNKHFGGTRNEYRLTRMTSFIRVHNLTAGDTLVFTRDDSNRYSIGYRRQKEVNEDGILSIGAVWKIVSLQG